MAKTKMTIEPRATSSKRPQNTSSIHGSNVAKKPNSLGSKPNIEKLVSEPESTKSKMVKFKDKNNIMIAKIISPHGIRGGVKLLIFCEPISNIEKYPLQDLQGCEIKLKLKGGKAAQPVGFTASGDQIVLATIEGVNDRDAAKMKVGVEIFTKRENFEKTKENEFYLADLIGLNVIDENNNRLGEVIDGQINNGLASLEIKFQADALPLLPPSYAIQESFPFKNDFFPKVAIENGTITFIPPEFVELQPEEAADSQ